MSWLPVYCLEDDLDNLLNLLGSDIAFLHPDGPDRWRATSAWRPQPRSRTGLWHVPSGPLPLYVKGKKTGAIPDPFAGWDADPGHHNKDVPYFGTGHPGVIWLNLRIPPNEAGSVCGLSSFEWIGNHYRAIGQPAHPDTEKWWAGLRRRIDKVATKVPLGGPGGRGRNEVRAFPDALAKLGKGDIYPF